MAEQEFMGKDEEFIIEYQNKFVEYLEGEEKELVIEPMNSYYRRLIHQFAKRFKFKSCSEGEGIDRHIVLYKTDHSQMPERINRKQTVVWNFGEREFLIDPLQNELEVYLGKDGSVGLYDESKKSDFITKKVVSGAFKIKMNKIVEVHEDEW